MTVSDPSRAKEIQRQALARMTPGQRMAVAMAMATEVKALTMAGIRMRGPELNEEQVYREWFTILHGPELTETILGPAT